jgi:uncharacterized membrane protein
MDFRRNIFAGVLTLIPILVTLLVFSFFLDLLSDIGRPKLMVLANAVRSVSPETASWILEIPWLSSTIAILLTIAMFYLIGWSMSRLFGRQLFAALEHGLKRIPLVTTVYGATKKLIDSFQTESGGTRRVVLIAFPHERMKAVGFVTRSFVDADTGMELAAVYVPTAPNPAGGYLEIVPTAELVPLDWSVDEAMTFVISGGTVAPETIRFNGMRPSAADKVDEQRAGDWQRTHSRSQPAHEEIESKPAVGASPAQARCGDAAPSEPSPRP